MGIIRKTVSISTLGIVPFRSRKELLKRAEKDRRAAEAELQREQAARLEADQRVTAAERRVRRAELVALHEGKVATKAKGKAGRGRRGRRRGGERTDRAKEMLTDLVAAAQPVVEEQAKEAGRRARKAAKASRKASRKAADVATERASEIKEEILDLTTNAADKVKERADAARATR
jgi:hypothetical protein